MKRVFVIGAIGLLAAALPAQAQTKKGDRYVVPTPYANSTQELARQREKEAQALAEKIAREKQKRKACTAEAKAQKIGMMKRRAFVRECVKR
jgi:hypothetical protein